MHPSRIAIVFLCLLLPACKQKQAESQPAGRPAANIQPTVLADSRNLLRQVADARSFTFEWTSEPHGDRAWTRYRIANQEGLAAVHQWLKENEEPVAASQLALAIIPSEHFYAVLPNGRKVYIQLLRQIPLDPKPVAHRRWRDNLPPEQIERLKEIFQRFGSSAEAVVPLKLGDGEATMLEKMKATDARDVTGQTPYRLDRAISGQQETFWWEYPDGTVVGVGLAGPDPGDLRIITIEIGEPGRGVAGIQHWRGQRLVSRTSIPAHDADQLQ